MIDIIILTLNNFIITIYTYSNLVNALSFILWLSGPIKFD